MKEHHSYELYLNIEDIDHTKTKARSPQTNGICERFHRTMQEEFYAIAFRKKMYDSLEQMQTDIDQWLQYYNNERPHSGRYCYGKTPMQTFETSKELAIAKDLNNIFGQNNTTFNLSGEAETGNAAVQPDRNSLTDGNDKAVENPTAFDSKSFLSQMP